MDDDCSGSAELQPALVKSEETSKEDRAVELFLIEEIEEALRVHLTIEE